MKPCLIVVLPFIVIIVIVITVVAEEPGTAMGMPLGLVIEIDQETQRAASAHSGGDALKLRGIDFFAVDPDLYAVFFVVVGTGDGVQLDALVLPRHPKAPELRALYDLLNLDLDSGLQVLQCLEFDRDLLDSSEPDFEPDLGSTSSTP